MSVRLMSDGTVTPACTRCAKNSVTYTVSSLSSVSLSLVMTMARGCARPGRVVVPVTVGPSEPAPPRAGLRLTVRAMVIVAPVTLTSETVPSAQLAT